MTAAGALAEQVAVEHARRDLRRALAAAVEACRSGYAALPELLADVLEDLAVHLGSVEALTRNCPTVDTAELVAELAAGAHQRIEDALVHEAIDLGHEYRAPYLADQQRAAVAACSCGTWPGPDPEDRDPDAYVRHAIRAVEDYHGARARYFGHEVIVVAGGPGLACSCGWNAGGDEPSSILTHLRGVSGGDT